MRDEPPLNIFLIKESLLDIVQTEAFAPIHVKAKAISDEATEFAENERFW